MILAAAIAAATILVSLFVAVVSDVPPVHQPGGIARVWIADAALSGGLRDATGAQFSAWRESSRGAESLTAVSQRTVLLGSINGSSARALAVSADYFNLARRYPQLGRPLVPSDLDARSAIISDRLWRDRFGADVAAIGQTLLIDATAYVIIGVMPPGFWFPMRGIDVWLPLQPGATDLVEIFGRLPAGRAWPEVQAELDVIAGSRTMLRSLPDEARIKLGPGLEALVAPAVAILLIACANVANLLLIRLFDCRQELAIRAALGARPVQLARLAMAEAVGLSALAAVAGSIFAWWGTTALRLVGSDALPAVAAVRLTSIGFMATATVMIAMIVLAPLPALRAARIRADALAFGGRRRAMSRRSAYGVGDVLLVAQVALAVVLVTVSAFDLRLFAEALRMGRPARSDGVLVTRMIAAREVAASAREALFERVVQQLRGRADIMGVALASALPQVGERRAIVLAGTDSASTTCAIKIARVTQGFFDVLGLTFRAGGIGSGPAAVASEAAMARCFSSISPQNPHIRLPEEQGSWIPITGVAADPFASRMTETSDAAAYIWVVRGREWPGSVYVLASLSAPLSGPPTLRATAGMAFDEWTPYRQRTSTNAEQMRLIVGMLGTISCVALLIAFAGVYAAMSHSCASLLPDLGIRLALGAPPWRAAMEALVRDAPLVGAGVAVGALGTAWVTAYVWRDLLMLSVLDLRVWLGVSGLVAAAAVLASIGPALRAARVDPLVLLRAE
jgi:putative ABC transport system permease protein